MHFVVQVCATHAAAGCLEVQHQGITRLMLERNDSGNVTRRTGIFSVVEQGGKVQSGDMIAADLPPHRRPLAPTGGARTSSAAACDSQCEHVV